MSDDGRDAIDALHEGRAFVDLSWWRKVSVAGADARGWLNDLLSADIAELAAGASRRSLLLSATGRVRADVSVVALDDGFLLVQDPEQAEGIDTLLERYILSSDVTIEDRTNDLALVAFPGRPAPSVEGATEVRPSVLAPGTDLLADVAGRDAIREAAAELTEAGAEAVEAWRIERGVPRTGIDLGLDSLPHEAELGDAIAYAKGCYLGQEAVAKVRNLGHPPYVVLAVETTGRAAAGDAIVGPEGEVGTITSATEAPDGRIAAIARVRWSARDSGLRTVAGARLSGVRPASAPA